LPRRALTAAAVDRIKPPSKGQVDHFDRGFPGLALRVSYGGGKSWVFFYRIGGRLRRMTLGTYPALILADAREAWREARQEAAAGRDPAKTRKRDKPAHDFESVAREWLRRDQSKKQSKREVERVLERELIPAWGHRCVAELGRRDILDLIDAIVDRGAPTMARRVQAYVHRFFKWCVGRGIVELNPAADLPKPGSESKRDRVLTDDELVAVWKASEQLGWPFGDAVRLLILTGARREEIGQLRRGEIADGQIRLSGDRTKNGEPHEIPLSAPAIDLLTGLPWVNGSELVFTTNGHNSISGWSRAKSALDNLANIAPWRIHDLRRTVATGLQRLGANLQVVEAVLGHISGSRAGVVGIYQRHNYANEKRAALEAWGENVIALVEKRKADVAVPFVAQNERAQNRL
jgi:integrase